MLQCARHQDELLCECKERQWKQLPPEKRLLAIKAATETLKNNIKTTDRGLFLDWVDVVKMKILGYKITGKGEVMKI